MNIEKIEERINKTLLRWKIPSLKEKKEVWQSITTIINHNQKQFILLQKWVLVAAASITAVIIISAIFYTSTIRYSTGANEKIMVALPDGSSINLNKESSVSFNVFSWFLNRSISLVGEAFFNVKKGGGFSVKTKNGVVNVLGTSFNVFSREKQFRVQCYKGKVEVDNFNKKIIIAKNEQIIQTNNSQTLIKKTFNKDYDVPTWTGNNYRYNNASLQHVLGDVVQQYRLTISTNDSTIDEMSFTGEWNSIMPLEDVLKIITLPFNLETVVFSEESILIQKSTK